MLLMVRAVRRPKRRLERARRRILQDGVPRYVRTMVRWLQIRQTERRDTESIVRLRVGSEPPGASRDSSPPSTTQSGGGRRYRAKSVPG